MSTGRQRRSPKLVRAPSATQAYFSHRERVPLPTRRSSKKEKKILVSPNGDPTQHSVRVCNLRSSSWLHENEERSKGRCCRVGPWGGGSGWRQWEISGGRTSLERHQNTAGIDRICAPLPIVEARTHQRRAPFPSASRSLRPVSLLLSLDPDKTRSNFCGLRPYRPLWPQMPCDANYDSHTPSQGGSSGSEIYRHRLKALRQRAGT